MNLINLRSNDDVVIPIPIEHVNSSSFMNEMIMEDSNLTEIPLDVPGRQLLLLVKFMNDHAVDPMPKISNPIDSDVMSEMVGPKYAAYVDDMNSEQLFDIVLNANYLGIGPFIDLCCAKIATNIKGKSVEQISEYIGLEKPPTDAEIDQTLKDNPWIRELVGQKQQC